MVPPEDTGPIVVPPPTCVDPATLPSWRRGMAIGEWKKLPSVNLAAVTPSRLIGGGFYGRINGWNGFAGDTVNSTLYLAAAGGHGDYAGNEVYALALAVDTPVWTLESQPSTDVTDNTPYYPDGKPSAAHLYYTAAYVAQRRKVYRFASAALWGDGNSNTRHIDVWDPATKAWDPPRSNGDMGPSPTVEMPGALDLSTGDFYQIQANNRLYRWDQVANKVSDLGNAGGGRDTHYDVNRSPSVVDTQNNRLLLLRDEANPRKVRAYNFAARTWTTHAVTGASAVVDAVTTGSEQGMAWFDSCANRIVLKTRRVGETFLLDPTSLEAVALATSGTTPPDADEGRGGPGVHTLFQYMPKLGGYAYQPHYEPGMYFLATQ